MKFDLDLLPEKELSEVYRDGNRFYKTPVGIFPSVTTVLSAMLDKSGMEEARKKIGEEEFEKRKRIGAHRGTQLHTCIERYIRGEDNIHRGLAADSYDMFNPLKKYLDKNVGKVLGVEIPLYSSLLKTAGRSDLVAFYNGKLSIIDYKNSTKHKKEEWIRSYYLQLTCYAKMFNDLYDQKIEQIVVLISCSDDSPQEFIRNPREFWTEVKEVYFRERPRCLIY